MKVYGIGQYFSKENGYQCRAVVAAKSKKRAAELFDCSMYTFNNYAAVTGNKREVKLAMSKPETVIIMEVYGYPHSDKQTAYQYHIEQADMGMTKCDKCGATLEK